MPDEPQTQNDSLGVNSVIAHSSTSDEQIVNKARELLGHEIFRKRTIEIIIDHTNSVPFMEKVQKYADDQIDKRLFKNVKVILGLIIAWIATGVIAYAVAVTTHKKAEPVNNEQKTVQAVN